MQFDPVSFSVAQGLIHWLKVFGASVTLTLIVTALASLALLGFRGPGAVFRQLFEGLRDVSELSPRRIGALAMLTFREAIRRKALLVFVVFAVLFMFGSWFLSVDNEKADIQIERYVVFVFTSISWLVLPVVLMLSCWGIPEDIKARSIHTVVTKPVRRVEIVLGRMAGFGMIATLIVALMSVVGYVSIDRQIPASARARMVCKVPVYGKMSFLDREGEPSRAGINVGDMWNFRSYVEGSSRACAVWEFENVGASYLAPADVDHATVDALRLQSSFESFRTHKGVINRGLLCELTLVNEEKKLRAPLPPFEVAEYRGDGNQTLVPRKISYYDSEARRQKEVDLLDDVLSNGKLRIEVRCLNLQQYIGVARPDLFIRVADRPFAVGYFKAIVGVWLQALLVAMIGVTVSCFVKGPIATLVTFAVLVIGQGFRGLIDKIVSGEQLGGGPIESVYRMVTHMNQTVDMDLSAPVIKAMKGIDEILNQGLWFVQQIFPDFSKFGMSPYVAKGFDVDFYAALLPSIAVTVGFFIPCVVIGYYSLKLRELESK